MSRSSSSLAERIWKRLTLRDDLQELEDYQTTWLVRLCRRFQEAVLALLLCVPPLYDALVIRSEQRAVLRAFIQFSFGLFLGILFHLCILIDLLMDEKVTLILGICISLFLAIGNVVSSQIRCISLIVPLRFGTSAGRNVIMAMTIVYLTSGPITNITNNLEEALRLIVCQIKKLFILTKNRFDLMFSPLGEAFVKVRADTEETKNLLNTVGEATHVIQDELVGEEEVDKLKEKNDYVDNQSGQSLRSEEIDKRLKVLPNDNTSTAIGKKYARKLYYRCESLVSEATTKCQQAFQQTQKTCEEKTFIFTFACSYLNVQDACNFKRLFGGDDVCNPKNVVPADLGKTYTFLKDSKDQLKSEFQQIKFHYKITEVSQDAKKIVNNISETVHTIFHKYKEEKGKLEFFTSVITRIAAFSFILIIISCNNYISNYLTDVEADNTYITWYFRKIDYRRYSKGKFTLLPLKSGERRELTDVYSFHLSTYDKAELLHAIIGTLLMFFFTILFISIDYLFYNILKDIREHGNISYQQIGHHDLSLEIKGVGFLASILRSLAHNFVIKKRFKQFSTNEDCLPNPSVPGKYNFKIFGSFFLLFMLSWMNVFVLKRASRYVCSLFYPKVEKKRTIFLYNQTFKKRVTYLNYRLDMVRRQAQEKKIPEALTFLLVLRLKHPRLFSWLLYFGQGRRKCIICNEPEPKSGGENRCTSLNCYLYYCQQCWDFVVKRKCLGCPKYVDKTPLVAEEV